MGKHSSPKPSFAKQLVRDLSAGKRPAGRRAATSPSTATSVLATVKQRPVVAAIAVPAAATAAVVGSTVMMGPPESGTVTSEAASTTPEEASPSSVSQEEIEAQREKAAKEYLEKVKDDPKYKNESSKTTLEVKTPKPEPKAETSPNSATEDDDSSEPADEKSSGDSKSSDDKQDEGTSSDTSAPPCSVSSSIESGLSQNAINGYRAVCAKFPEVKTYGGRRPGTGSDHNTGNAVDIMITGSTGDRIADYLIKNHSSLNIKYVIWEQRIWMPGRGWSGMEDRGGATANHFDHVHASFN